MAMPKTPLSVRLSDSMLSRLRVQAEREERTLSEMVRYALDRYLAEPPDRRSRKKAPDGPAPKRN